MFQCDIHPAAKVGRGIFLDHATGLVVGETATIGDNVSMLHGVTLGGTGKDHGDRHPKIGDGVLIGAGASIIGNIDGRPLRPHRGGLGGAQGCPEQRHRRRRAGEGRRRFPVPGAVAHHGSHVPWIIVGLFGIPARPVG